MMNEQLPLADSHRERLVEAIFGKDYLTMQPEEWVARFSHTLGCSSCNEYRYQDEKLHQWIHRVHEILLDPTEDISAYRKKYLTEQEIKDIENYYF